MPSNLIFSLLLDNNGSYVTSRVETQHTVHGAEARMTFTCRKGKNGFTGHTIHDDVEAFLTLKQRYSTRF